MTDIESSYCNVCKNRGIKYPLGIICKLTQKKPHFGQNCGDYNFDSEEYQKLKDNRIRYYQDLNEKGNSFGRKINSNTISYEETHVSQRSESELGSRLPVIMEIRSSIHHYFYMYILPCILCIIVFAYFLLKQWTHVHYTIMAFGIIALSVGVIIYALSKIINNKPKIILNSKGIELKGKGLIIWRDVLMTQIKRTQERFVFEYLCISQISKTKDTEIDIKELNILSWQLGHYIELYKRKYQQL